MVVAMVFEKSSTTRSSSSRLRHGKVLQSSQIQHDPRRARRRKLFKNGAKKILHRCEGVPLDRRLGRAHQVPGQEHDGLRRIFRVERSLPGHGRRQAWFLRPLPGLERPGTNTAKLFFQFLTLFDLTSNLSFHTNLSLFGGHLEATQSMTLELR